MESVDFSEIIAKTNLEMQRLGLTAEWVREYLKKNYSKRSRLLLTEEELVDFLKYLELEPTPDSNKLES